MNLGRWNAVAQSVVRVKHVKMSDISLGTCPRDNQVADDGCRETLI